MNITITTHRAPEPEPERTGPAAIGWFMRDAVDLSYAAPERVSFRGGNRTHAKSASRCPGVIQLESRYFLIRSPLKLDLDFRRDDNGAPTLFDNGSSHPDWARHVSLVPQTQWRNPAIPTIRLNLPYHFMSDEVCYLMQLDSFAHFRPDALPGVIVGRRMPINAWLTNIGWTFEWYDTGKALSVNENDPLFYCQFEVAGPDRPIQLTPCEITPELRIWMEKMDEVADAAAQMRILLRTAEDARPAQLLPPRAR